MGLAARRDNVPWGKASGRVEKHMVSEPRRIGALPVRITMPRELPKEQRARFEEIGRTCPVARSLNPAIALEMKFEYLP